MLILGLIVGLSFAIYWYSAISGEIKQILGLTILELNLFQSIAAFPNIILPFFGGLFLDKVGIRLSTHILTIVLIIGLIIQTIGASKNSYVIMLVGQGFQSLTLCNLYVLAFAYVPRWHEVNELAFVISLIVSFTHLIQAIVPYILVPLCNINDSLVEACLFLLGAAVFSWLVGFFVIYYDKKNQKQEEQLQALGSKEQFNRFSKVGLKDLKQFKFNFWLVVIVNALGYIGIYQFLGNFQQFVEYQYSMDKDRSSQIQQIPKFMTIPLGPLIGWMVDKVGKKGEILIISQFIMAGSYLMLMFGPKYTDGFDQSSYVWLITVLVIQGIGFSLFSTVTWSCVTIFCSKKMAGTANGFAQCGLQAGFTVSPVIIAHIISGTSDREGGWYWFLMFYFLISVLCILLCLILWFNDIKSDKILHNVPLAKTRTRSSMAIALMTEKEEENK